MARKLNTEEENGFARAWEKAEPSASEEGYEWFQERLSRQRDASLALSPELDEWFGLELTKRSES
jgi:hypothetical protein